MHKCMLRKLYKASQIITQTKLSGQFNKLLYRFTIDINEDKKDPQISHKKLTKQLKLEEEKTTKEVEEEDEKEKYQLFL